MFKTYPTNSSCTISVFKHFICLTNDFEQELLIFFNALFYFLKMILKIWKHFLVPSREKRIVFFGSLKLSQGVFPAGKKKRSDDFKSAKWGCVKAGLSKSFEVDDWVVKVSSQSRDILFKKMPSVKKSQAEY